eukprot:TRINITY_DN345_c0_g1_i6.p1 TRINITY_DN345_c0_g1~~TRINITY_DN345_c0_g1_i6.p1  ORF type:complete len:421 (+),score=134.37 TRINITY_DN345_c0_g1_i6:49-1311(+)
MYKKIKLNKNLLKNNRWYSTSVSKQIVICGGGTAGLSIGSKLSRKYGASNITIIEPSEYHFYQPGFTMVGGGIFKREDMRRFEKDYIPEGTKWVKDRVVQFDPEQNTVITDKNEKIKYDVLIVTTGMEIKPETIKGLPESLGKNGVCTNYMYDYVDFTWKFLQEMKSGKAIFTQPNTPIKCAGAPQKIMYLAEDYWKTKGIRKDISIEFNTGMPSIFSSPHYAASLLDLCKSRDISLHFKHNLVEVKGESNEAIFQDLETNKTIVKKYDFLHVTPQMGPPKVIKESPLALKEGPGFIDVNKETTQHNKYPNVFSIGDASSLPTSKTAAAITKQSKVSAGNIISFIEGKTLQNKYDGYSSCPIVTKKGGLILAEFDYNLQPKETFPFDQRKESSLLYNLKTKIFPPLYWDHLLKGNWRYGY